ncbi:MAG: hypothetical protein JRN38_06190 [Nitrososphaerota archaeon]|jgi:hypothetical protein|nr:hypothetical protein [Nitrososphaerota archaeon]
MANLEVKVRNKSDAFAARIADIRLNSAARVTTPRRGLYLANDPLCEARFVPKKDRHGVIEIVKYITPETVDRIDSDNDKQRDFTTRVLPKFLQDEFADELVLAIFRLADPKTRKPWLPSEAQVNYLADLLTAVPTPVVVPPSLEGYSPEETINFLTKFHRRMDSFPNRQVLGMIPYMESYRDQNALQEFYLKQGVTGYVWDLRGHTPSGLSANWNSIVAHLGHVEREHGPHYAHALNARYAQERRTIQSLPARDLLMLFSAFDSVGASHIRPNYPEEVRKKMLENPQSPIIRLFQSRTYGYDQVPEAKVPSVLKSTVESNGLMDGAAAILKDGMDLQVAKKIARLVSAYRTAKETEALHTHIKEKTDEEYLLGKSTISTHLDGVRNLRDTYLAAQPGRSGRRSPGRKSDLNEVI